MYMYVCKDLAAPAQYVIVLSTNQLIKILKESYTRAQQEKPHPTAPPHTWAANPASRSDAEAWGLGAKSKSRKR